MFYKCLLLLFFSGLIDAQYPYHRPQQCPFPHLDHGKVRVRQRTKLVKFMCTFRYELVGNRYATCNNGEWDVPMPVCVRPGCPELPVPPNSVQIKAHHDAWVVTFCMPGYTLVGSSAIYCNGAKWNATAPTCDGSTEKASLSCDFENPNLCGWKQDDLHDFDWKRLNSKTPSSFLNTGPSYDHTLGEGKAGYYMYIESTARANNDTARLLSPVFNAQLAVDGCFSFFYHMFGKSIGGLKVYQKPDRVKMEELLNMTETDKTQYVLFEQWGNLGDFWFSAAPALKDFHEDFQIVIEGIRGHSFTSDIAIDDVAVLQGQNCSNFRIAATSPAPVVSDSCAGRCHVDKGSDSGTGCGCSLMCINSDRCCSDFVDLCITFETGNNTGSSDPYDTSPTDAQPQTEKLIYESTTATPTARSRYSTATNTQPPSTTASTTAFIPTTTYAPETTTVQSTTTTRRIKTTLPKTTTRATTSRKISSTTTKFTVPVKVPSETTTTGPTTVIVRKTTQITTRKWPSSKGMTATSTNTPIAEETQKSEKEVNMQRIVVEKAVHGKSSSWKTAIITIVILTAFAALIYLAVVSRTTRGRVALARLRGRVMASNDSEVQYLSTTDDDL